MTIPSPDAWDRVSRTVRDHESRVGGQHHQPNYIDHPDPGSVTVRVTGAREDMDTADPTADPPTPAHDRAGVYPALFVYRNSLWDGLDDDPAWFDGSECYVQEVNDKDLQDDYYRGHVVGTYKDKALVLVETGASSPAGCVGCGWTLDLAPLVGAMAGTGGSTTDQPALRVTFPKAFGRCACFPISQGSLASGGQQAIYAIYIGDVDLFGDGVLWPGFVVNAQVHTCCGCGDVTIFFNPLYGSEPAYFPDPAVAFMDIDSRCDTPGTPDTLVLRFSCCVDGAVSFVVAGPRLCDGVPDDCINYVEMKVKCETCSLGGVPCQWCKFNESASVVKVQVDPAALFTFTGAMAAYDRPIWYCRTDGDNTCTWSITCHGITVQAKAEYDSSIATYGQTKLTVTYSGLGTATYSVNDPGFVCSGNLPASGTPTGEWAEKVIMSQVFCLFPGYFCETMVSLNATFLVEFAGSSAADECGDYAGGSYTVHYDVGITDFCGSTWTSGGLAPAQICCLGFRFKIRTSASSCFQNVNADITSMTRDPFQENVKCASPHGCTASITRLTPFP